MKMHLAANSSLLCAATILAAAGCLPALEDADARAARMAMESSGGVHSAPGSPHRARWYLIRYWLAPQDQGEGLSARDRIESLASDVFAAGLSASLGSPPADAHTSAILLQSGQTGFLAVWRGTPSPPFEVGGRPLGGVPIDRGFEVAPSVKSGMIQLELAPLFRGQADSGGDLRVPSLAFTVSLGEGEILRLCAAAGAPSDVLRAVFSSADGSMRVLWLRVESFQ